MRTSAPLTRCLSFLLACTHLFWSTALLAAMTPGGPGESIAIVSNVSGEALVRPAEDPARARAASFRGPVVYGDRITTSKDSTLGLLLGQRDLLTVLELSDVSIKEPKPGFKVIDMSSGKVCMAIPKLVAKGEQPTTIRTPNTTATAQPGTLFQVEVNTAPGTTRTNPRETPDGEGGRIYRTSLLAQAGGTAPPTIETFTVIEGSVEIVSQVTASTPVRLTAGRAVKVVNGVIGEPYEAPPVTCRMQDAHVAPIHTTIPPGARETINAREIQQAELLVAHVQRPPKPPGPQDLQRSVPGGLVLPTTRLYAFGGPAVPPPILPPPPLPVLVFQGSIVQQTEPFLSVIDPPNTQKGPDVLFQLNGYNGNNSNVPLGAVGLNIFNLGEYRDPTNPQILQARIEVQSTSGVNVPIVHGVSFINSTITPGPGYTGPVVQIEDSRVTAFSPLPGQTGILVRLIGSQLTSNDFLLHQNTKGPVNETILHGTLLQAEQGSQVTVNGTFANVDPSTITINGSLLTLMGGSTMTTTGPLIDLTGSTLNGNLSPLVTVNGGTLNLGSAGSPAGLARLTNSTINANAGLLSVSAGAVNSTGTFIAMLGSSAVNGTGNLISVGNGGTLNLGGASLLGGSGTVNVTGDIVNLSGTGALTNTVGAAPVFTVGGGPTVTVGGALFNMTGNGTATLASPLLQLAGGATAAGATALLQVAAGTVTDTTALINVTGATTLNRPALGISGGSVSPAVGIQIDAGLTTGAGTSVFTVSGGTLSPTGILAFVDADSTLGGSLVTQSGGTVSTGGDALSVVGATLNSTSGVIPVFNLTGGTFTTGVNLVNVLGGTLTVNSTLASLTGSTMNIGNSVLSAGSAANVTIAGNLASLAGGSTLSVTGSLATGGLVTATNGSTVTIGGTLATVPAGNTLAGTNSLINTADSTLTVNGAGPALNLGGALTVSNGGLLTASGGTTTLAGPLASVTGALTAGGAAGGTLINLASNSTFSSQQNAAVPSPVITAGSATINNGGIVSSQDGTVAMGGALASVTGNLTAGAPLINLTRDTLGTTLSVGTVTGSLTPSAITVGGNLTVTAGGLNNGGLLDATGATINAQGLQANLANIGPGGPLPSALVSIQGGSTVTFTQGLIALNSSSLTVNVSNANPLVAVSGAGTNLTLILGDLLSLKNGSTLVNLSANQALLAATAGGTVSIGGNLLTLENNAFPARTAPLLTVNADSDTNTGVTISGAVASLSNASTLTITNAGLVNIFNTNQIGQIQSLGSFALIQSGSTLTVGSHFADINNSTVNLTGTGPAVSVNGGTLNVTAVGAASSHLVNLSNSILTAPNGLLAVANGGTATISGNVVAMNPSTLNVTNGLLTLSGGSTVTVAGILASVPAGSNLVPTGTLVTTNASTLNVNIGLPAISVGSITTGGSNASLAIANGGLLSSSGGVVNLANGLAGVFGGDGAAGTSQAGGNASLSGTAGLISLSNGATLNNGDVIVTGGIGGTNPNANGGTGGSASISVTGGAPLTVNGATYSIVDDIFDIRAGSGGNGATTGGNGGNASFTASTTVAVVTNGGTINNTDGRLLQVFAGNGGNGNTGPGGAGGTATVTLGAGLLSVNAGTVTNVGQLARLQGRIGGIDGTGAITGNGGNAILTAGSTLIILTGGSTLGSEGIFVLGGNGVVAGTGSLTVAGGILSANGGQIAITNDFVNVNGNLRATGVLVNLSNMTGSNPASFTDHLINISSPTLCNTPGQCSSAPGVLQATDVGAAANPITVGGSVLALDLMLFEATAPLINLVRSHLNTASALSMANNATYISNNPANAFASLDASTLNATGALVTLAGGTFTHAGNLVSLANGSTLIANSLAFISAGSFNVGGALVALSGIGNTLTINANCGGGCTTFGVNVPILFQNGATLGNTMVNIPATYNAFSGPIAGNTLPGLTKPLLIVDGPGAKSVKLGP